jgi:hypothetical protein
MWSFDSCGGLPKTRKGNTYIHLFVDFFSQYIILVPAYSKSAESIQHNFLHYVLWQFMPGFALRSDGERGVAKSADFKDFASSLGITLMPTAASSPATNGQAENKIGYIKGLIRTYCMQMNHQEWDQDIHLLQFSINKTTTTYGYSPEEVMFGNITPSRLDLLQITEKPQTQEEYLDMIKDNFAEISQRVETLRAANRQATEQYKNQHRRTRQFFEGDIVYMRNVVISNHGALSCKFRGPYLVRRVSDHEHTAVIEDLVTGITTKHHYNHLKLMNDPNFEASINSNWDKDLRDIIAQQNALNDPQSPPASPQDDPLADPPEDPQP